jgi:hypothetical protein
MYYICIFVYICVKLVINSSVLNKINTSPLLSTVGSSPEDYLTALAEALFYVLDQANSTTPDSVQICICMYICMYVYIYTYTYIYIYV